MLHCGDLCNVFCFRIICLAAIFGLRASRSHPAAFDRWEDSHSIWPVTVRSCADVVLTTQSNYEIWWVLVNQAQAHRAKEDVRGHPDTPKPIEHQNPSLTPPPWTVPKFFGLFICSPAALVKFKQLTGEQLLFMINLLKTDCTQEAVYQSHSQQFASSEHGGAFNSFTADLLLRIWRRPKWVEKWFTYKMVTCLLYSTFFNCRQVVWKEVIAAF